LGKEVYRSWRTEVFSSLGILTLAFLGTLLLGDKNAVLAFEVAVAANMGWLLLFAIFHLVRAPWIMHREPGAAAENGWGWGIAGIAVILLMGVSLVVGGVAVYVGGPRKVPPINFPTPNLPAFPATVAVPNYAPPKEFRNNMSVRQTFEIVGQLHGTFARQNPPLTFVITAPHESARFRQNFYTMIVAACQGIPEKSSCLIEPAPDPNVELDTGIPTPKYPGIVIHAPDSLPDLLGTMLKQYLGKCFLIHKTTKVVEGISQLKNKREQDSQLVWFELGPGSPWNQGGGCEMN
jgi:hypothetical protein